jgi:hypothetical protein
MWNIISPQASIWRFESAGKAILHNPAHELQAQYFTGQSPGNRKGRRFTRGPFSTPLRSPAL